MRAIYLPRTPPFNLDRSHSRPNSSPPVCFSVFFFILFSVSLRLIIPRSRPRGDWFLLFPPFDLPDTLIRNPFNRRPLFHAKRMRREKREWKRRRDVFLGGPSTEGELKRMNEKNRPPQSAAGT